MSALDISSGSTDPALIKPELGAPFNLLPSAFGIHPNDFGMATNDERARIQRAVQQCRFSVYKTYGTMLVAMQESPSNQFRKRSYNLFVNDDKRVVTFSLIIRYAMIRLRLWGTKESTDGLAMEELQEQTRVRGRIVPADLDAFADYFGLDSSTSYTLPPAARSATFFSKILLRDDETCLLSNASDHAKVHVAHLASHSWRPKRGKTDADYEKSVHDCRSTGLFLAAWLGLEIFRDLVDKLQHENPSNGITMERGLHQDFDSACFTLEPVLGTIIRDENDQVVEYEMLFRAHHARYHGAGWQTTTIAIGSDGLYVPFSPNMKFRVYRQNSASGEVDLPDPALLLIQACISRIIMYSGLALKAGELNTAKSSRHPTQSPGGGGSAPSSSSRSRKSPPPFSGPGGSGGPSGASSGASGLPELKTPSKNSLKRSRNSPGEAEGSHKRTTLDIQSKNITETPPHNPTDFDTSLGSIETSATTPFKQPLSQVKLNTIGSTEASAWDENKEDSVDEDENEEDAVDEDEGWEDDNFSNAFQKKIERLFRETTTTSQDMANRVNALCHYWE